MEAVVVGDDRLDAERRPSEQAHDLVDDHVVADVDAAFREQGDEIVAGARLQQEKHRAATIDMTTEHLELVLQERPLRVGDHEEARVGGNVGDRCEQERLHRGPLVFERRLELPQPGRRIACLEVGLAVARREVDLLGVGGREPDQRVGELFFR